eukprot:3540222-Rhodomonas_salina.2
MKQETPDIHARKWTDRRPRSCHGGVLGAVRLGLGRERHKLRLWHKPDGGHKAHGCLDRGPQRWRCTFGRFRAEVAGRCHGRRRVCGRSGASALRVGGREGRLLAELEVSMGTERSPLVAWLVLFAASPSLWLRVLASSCCSTSTPLSST